MKFVKLFFSFLLIISLISLSYSNCNSSGDFVKNTNNPIISPDTNSWDSVYIVRQTYYYNGTHYFIYYGGGSEADSRGEINIGLYVGTSLNSISKYQVKPIINRTDITYGGTGEGVYPSTVIKIGDIYYMYLDLYRSSGSNNKLGVMTSYDLIHWDNLTQLTGSGMNTDARDDRAIVKINPQNSNQLIMIYAYVVGGFRLARATANINNPYYWTVTDTDLLSDGSTSIQYADWVYDNDNVGCTLYYSTQTTYPSGWDIRNTHSDDCLEFSKGSTVLSVSSSGWDDYYVSGTNIIRDKENGIEYMLYQGRTHENDGESYVGVGYAYRDLYCDNITVAYKTYIKVNINSINNSIKEITLSKQGLFLSRTSKIINWNNLIWGETQ